VQKVFLLGLGAQKSGTSWLFDYLNQNPRSRFGLAKEYHVLDAHFVPFFYSFHEERVKKLEAALSSGTGEDDRALDRLRTFIDFVEDIDGYFDHFAALAHGAEGAVLTGDLTPSHCALQSDAMRAVDRAFAERGIEVRAVQLVRDPVERIISMARMVIRNEKGRPALLHEEVALINEHVGSESVRIRSDYKSTREAASRVFGDRFLHCFYEELFSETKLDELCAFLGIPYAAPDFGKFVNVSRTDNRLPEECRLRIFGSVADQYRYYTDEFGEDRIRSVWPGCVAVHDAAERNRSL
jgi:hypothetical protein